MPGLPQRRVDPRMFSVGRDHELPCGLTRNGAVVDGLGLPRGKGHIRRPLATDGFLSCVKMEPMGRELVSSGSTFEAEIGYSRAVVADPWVFVSGTTGFDYATMTISGEVVAQTDQCLRNIESALLQAGSSLAEVVRVHYILPNAEDFPLCWPSLKRAFGECRPAATMISAGLSAPRMKIEIEVTALKGSAL